MKRGTRSTTRKPPEPAEDHRDIDQWLGRQMPDLQPVVSRVDDLIREAIPGLQFAVKWKQAYYGTPDLGWLVELVAYDVSVNIVFLGGADFADPPPSGSGRSRYVKVKSLEELDETLMRAWLRQAARTRGWT